MNKTEAKKNFIKKSLPLVVAFLAPIIILIIIYATREIFPFGDQMYLRSDMYHQYAPFLKLFQNTIKHGGSLDYTWNIGLGSNFLSTYAYYLASPINWLVGLLPSNYIPEIMSGFIMLKSGLMSSFMTYYLIRKFNRNAAGGEVIASDVAMEQGIEKPKKRIVQGTPNDYIAACFGIFYAMSGYMAAYSWNVMWLDCLCILPIMMLGLERLVKERKCLLYTICFAIAVLSNYYIAIMLCIYSLLYFIYLLVAERGQRILETIGRYLLYSFIGGCIGAVIFLPALMTLFGTASADSSFPENLNAYYNLLEMFAHGTMNAKVTMLEGYVPNIYCGIAIFALIPLYWLNRTIPVMQRAGKTILMAIMIFSFTFNVPAFIWHGFHFPNSLPSRQSFIYIFLVLTMGYEAFLRIRKITVREIIICFGVAIAAVFALQALYNSEEYPMSVAYVSAAFLIVYGVVALLLNRKKYLVRCAAVAILVIICVAEMVINTDETGYGTTSRVSYTEDNRAIDTVLGKIEDDDFYRVEKLKRRTKNDGAWSGYKSASVFSSVTKAAVSDFYESFGLQNGTNSFSYYGNTPFTSALLGVRYVMTDEQMDDSYLQFIAKEKLGKEKVPGLAEPQIAENAAEESIDLDYGSIFLYKNKYSLPLGFMIRETAQAEVNLMTQNPFVVQNDFADAAAGAGPIFTIGDNIQGSEIRYTVQESGRLYFYIGQKLKNLTITMEKGEIPGSSNTFTSLECAMIIDAGEVRKGDELKLTTADEDVEQFMVIPAMLDEDALDDVISALGSEPLEVESFGDTYVKGSVNVSQAGMLFTSIPYDKGWSAYVDGKKTEIKDFYGAFVQIPLDAGTHSIELRYRVPGKTAGLIVSILAVLALICFSIFKKKGVTLKKKPQKNS